MLDLPQPPQFASIDRSMPPTPIVEMSSAPARSFAAVAAAAQAAKANPNAPRQTRAAACSGDPPASSIAKPTKTGNAIDLTDEMTPKEVLERELDERRRKVAGAKKARDEKKLQATAEKKRREEARREPTTARQQEQALRLEGIRLSRAARAREAEAKKRRWWRRRKRWLQRWRRWRRRLRALVMRRRR